MNDIATNLDEPIGLIAGAGRLPLLVAEGIVESGRRVICCGLDGFAHPRLNHYCDDYRSVGLAKPGSWLRFLKSHGCQQAVMIGSVHKSAMHCRFRWLKFLPDLRAIRIWYHRLRHDKRDNAVLMAIADDLASQGVPLMSSIEFCADHLATEGVMTQTQPAATAAADIEFGWHIAIASADLDIGQALAVKERDIIAVEAVEGTDRMIARAGELCKSGGWTMIKVARPEQDPRFDVPTVGPKTIRNLHAAGCNTLVIQAGMTLIADKPATLELADSLKIAVVGKTPAKTDHAKFTE
ncbi:MAG: UDP-2,3-diacylglucosamine diphosphatase LpxI [Phycisphaerales bacterium]|jgi:UDP-2,3-diacylglucosamine hydrolase|nr:UDP-2,3-diacylglucosamine diphosphatase LpxI [Phycisphaerales bacterium]